MTRANAKKLCFIIALITPLLISVSTVMAPPPPHYDYDVTSDYHGVKVPLGTLVTVTATTNDPGVTGVTFIWRDPDGNEVLRTDDYAFPYADQFTPNIVGDWGVQAVFRGPDGTPVPGLDITDKIEIRATSFFVVPELPIVGTAGSLLSMLAGFYYIRKKKG